MSGFIFPDCSKYCRCSCIILKSQIVFHILGDTEDIKKKDTEELKRLQSQYLLLLIL